MNINFKLEIGNYPKNCDQCDVKKSPYEIEVEVNLNVNVQIAEKTIM